MRYIPEITKEEIEENYKIFSERRALYKARGLDFAKSRKNILAKAGLLRGRVLEIASGTGDTTIALAKAGYKVSAIDKNTDALKITAMNLAYEKLLSSVELFQMEASHMGYKDRTFSNIVCVSSFHHMANPGDILLEIDRVLRDDGRIVLADFNEHGMETVRAFHAEEGRPHEECGAGKDFIKKYIKNLGFKVGEHNVGFLWIITGCKY